MGKIKTLSPDLVSLISAGEVIDGPWSVVKELIENALDAGAKHIDVEIKNGGIDSIKVSDNGSGITKTDIRLCGLRHSTSKVAAKSDLESIATYGFRGEALASMAAVADVEITSRSASEDIGTRLVSRASELRTYSDASRPQGTTVEVTSLFERVPARKKHLASPKTEGQRVVDVIMRHAIARPDIGFRLIKDGQTTIDCPPQSAKDRVAAIWGADVAKNLVDIDFVSDETRVRGFLARPPVSRGNRSHEYFYVRGRPIEDGQLSGALESVYSSLLMRGRYPVSALDVSLDATRVDANVHPTKREVRISDMEEVKTALKSAAREALALETPPKEPAFVLDREAAPESTKAASRMGSKRTDRSHAASVLTDTLVEADTLRVPPISKTDDTMQIPALGGVFRIIGQLQNLYVLLEFEDGLVLVDQHAAHERVMYERLRRELDSGPMPIQELLEPIVLRLEHGDSDRVLELAQPLNALGYTVASFGGNEVLISTLPDVLGHQVSDNDVLAIIDEILELGEEHVSKHFMDEVVKLTACHAAIRAGQPLNIEEIRDLLTSMAGTPNRYNCPHGRPTLVRITSDELEKRFGRIQP
jgi:DNA mismatch repair protein MutL